MRNLGKKNIVGILIDAVDYEEALNFIFRRAAEGRGATISALAVHGVMTGVLDPRHKFRLNRFDLLVPDGQPVKWVLNLLHRTKLVDRVYGPKLTLKVCERAAVEGVPIYLYGSTVEILASLRETLLSKFPGIQIAGSEPSKFRRLKPEEKIEVAERIHASGARITLVGLGCPRQEVFAYENREALGMPILAVGAAFPFIAGLVPQAPPWMQARGMEWIFRLFAEPKRLWRRYLYLNPAYVSLVMIQAARLLRFRTEGVAPSSEELYG